MSSKQDLLNTGVVENVALSDYTTLYGGNNTGGFTWQGKDPNAQILGFNQECKHGVYERFRHQITGRDGIFN